MFEGNELEIKPPETTNSQELYGVYGATIFVLANDLRELFEMHLAPKIGPNWFEMIRQLRAPYFDRTNPGDVLFYLKEPFHNADSLIWNYIGDRQTIRPLLRDLILYRNDMAHLDATSSIENLYLFVDKVEILAFELGLRHLKNYEEVRIRCKALRDGNYKAAASNETNSGRLFKLNNKQIEPGQAEILRRYEIEIQDALARLNYLVRPEIGQPWEGPLGRRRLRLSKITRDVFDSVSGISLKPDLGPNSTSKISSWIDFVQVDADLYMDDDGAVAGPVGGQMCLIGYVFDPAATEFEIIRGPLTYEYFYVRGTEVFNRASSEPLQFISNGLIDISNFQDAEVRITVKGDVGLLHPETLERIKIGKIATL